VAELNLTNIAAASIATPAAGLVAVFADTADKRAKQRDETGALSILVNDGLQDRNLLHNGGLMIQQKVATASTAIPGVSATTRAGQISDRWAMTVGNVTTPSWAQIDAAAAPETGLASRYYGKITQATNAAKFIMSQWMIAADMDSIRGLKVRASCKIKQFAGSNAVYRLGLLQLNTAGTADTSPGPFCAAVGAASVEPTWGTNIVAITPDASPSGENGTITGVALSITSTAEWVRSSCVFTVPTDCRNLIFVLYRDTLGGVNDACGIAELQLTIGQEIVDWVQPTQAEELVRCQRFFAKTFAQTTVPVQNAGINTGEAKGVAGLAGAVAASGHVFWRFPITMWKTPTVTLFNPAAANALMRMIARAADMGATANTLQLDASTMVIATGVAATAIGDQLGIHITAEADFVS
jgi:hypothetical protein